MKRVLSLLAIVSLCLLVSTASFAATIAGHWEGPIKIPGMELKVLVDLSSSPDGAWTGTIDIPAQGTKGLALKNVSLDGSAVVFAIVGPPGDPTFKGTLSDDGSMIKGTFTQSGQSFPFELTRTGEAAVGKGAPSTDAALEGFDAFVDESPRRSGASRAPGSRS